MQDIPIDKDFFWEILSPKRVLKFQTNILTKIPVGDIIKKTIYNKKYFS